MEQRRIIGNISCQKKYNITKENVEEKKFFRNVFMKKKSEKHYYKERNIFRFNDSIGQKLFN